MVDLNIVKETQYINVDLVRDSQTKKLVVLGEGVIRSMGLGGDKLIVPVEIEKKKKLWIVKRTDYNEVIKYGKDSKQLVGKVFSLEVHQTNEGIDFVKAFAHDN